MKYVSASDVAAIGRAVDEAQREPVVIRRDQRDVAVVLSMADFEKLKGTAVDEFQRFCDRVGAAAAARGMTEERLAAILADG